MYLQQGMMNTQTLLNRYQNALQNNIAGMMNAGQQSMQDGIQARNAIQQRNHQSMQMAQQAQAEEDARRNQMGSSLMRFGLGAVTGGIGAGTSGSAPTILSGVGKDSVQQAAGNELLGGLGNFSQGIQNSQYGQYSNLAAPGTNNWF